MEMRIRSIKPSIHTDEVLWDAEAETGLPLFRAFTALWSVADREGRFEWRPRALKAFCLPYADGLDFSRVLDALTTRGFLVHYASQDGREWGQIRTFTEHQVINNRERASRIPAPPGLDESGTFPVTSTRAPRVPHACPTPLCPAQAEGEGEGEELTTKTARTLNPPSSTANRASRGPVGAHDNDNNTRAQLIDFPEDEPDPCPWLDEPSPFPASQDPLQPSKAEEAMPVPLDDSQAAEPPSWPGNHAPEPWLAVAKLYADKFLEATTRPIAIHLHKESWEAIVLESGGDMDLVEKSLSNYWGDEWAAEHRWPPKAWAKQFHRHLENSPKKRVKRRELTYAEEQVLSRNWPDIWKEQIEMHGEDEAVRLCHEYMAERSRRFREKMEARDRELAAAREKLPQRRESTPTRVSFG